MGWQSCGLRSFFFAFSLNLAFAGESGLLTTFSFPLITTMMIIPLCDALQMALLQEE
jgi:hypothetical protein